MSFVHTAFGRGQIIGEETVRGRKQYLVAGSGFQMWIDEADAQIHTGAADFDFERSARALAMTASVKASRSS